MQGFWKDAIEQKLEKLQDKPKLNFPIKQQPADGQEEEVKSEDDNINNNLANAGDDDAAKE